VEERRIKRDDKDEVEDEQSHFIILALFYSGGVQESGIRRWRTIYYFTPSLYRPMDGGQRGGEIGRGVLNDQDLSNQMLQF
jgi:hypothetical protein